jgi:hypothetical protein
MLDTHAIFVAGRPSIALVYLLGTLVMGLVAVWVGIVAGRGAARVLRTRGRGDGPTDPERTERTERTRITGSGASDARKGRRLP